MPEQKTQQGENYSGSSDSGLFNDSRDVHLQRLLPDLGDTSPVFIRLFRSLAEIVNPPKLPPLAITSRPVDLKEALKNISSEDLEQSGLKTFFQNVKELISPTPLPPLEVTSRPVPREEVYGQLLPEDSHHLLVKDIFRGIRETLFPAKQVPLQLTSKPLPVKDIWTRSKYENWSRLASIGVHGAIIALALLISIAPSVTETKPKTEFKVVQLSEPPLLTAPPKKEMMAGGGGGGGTGR